MSNGDDTEYISAEEKRGWIDECSPALVRHKSDYLAGHDLGR